jgi:hypothetical protein
VPETDEQRGGPAGNVVLEPREAARQGRPSSVVGRGVGRHRHADAQHLALVARFPGIRAQAGDDAVPLAERVIHLAEQTDAAEPGVVHARERLVGVGVLVHGRAQRVRVFLQVRADAGDRAAGPRQIDHRLAPGGATVRVLHGLARHARRGREVAQAVVVHHVIDVVVVRLRLDPADAAFGAASLETEAQVLAIERHAVHRAIGIGCFAVAQDAGEFDERVGVGVSSRWRRSCSSARRPSARGCRRRRRSRPPRRVCR